MKKCPRGVICVNHYVVTFIFIIIIVLFFIFGSFSQTIILNNQPREKIVVKNEESNNNPNDGWLSSWLPNYPYTNLTNDVLLNPYAAPLRDERYIRGPLTVPPLSVPINVSTNVGAVNTNYRQVGFLTSINTEKDERILPLLGRPLFTTRDKWQYYTISDQRNSIKLPVIKNRKNCTNEYGCDSLYNGEKVFIEGINKYYKVSLYENNTIQYLPFF